MKRFFAMVLALLIAMSASALAEFPLTEEPITLTCFSRTDSRTTGDLNDMIFWDYYEDLTNVHVEVTSVDSSIYMEKLNLMFTGNDLPDILFCGSVDISFIQQNAEAGLLLPLNDLIAEYAPNLTALFEERPDWRLDCTLPDGNIYVMPNISMPFRTNSMQLINEKWLAELGLEKPTNTDELYDTLVAFRDGDPNGNGLADEIPLTFSSLSYMYNSMAWFDLLYGSNFCFEDKDGTVVFAPYTDNFKEWLLFMKKLYSEKLLDNDLFVQTNTQVIAKGSGEYQLNGMSIANGVTNFVSGDYAYDYGVLPVLTSATGQKMFPGRNQCQATSRGFLITSACEHPEIAVQWCDYFYTQPGAELIWMGVEGVNYVRTEEGSYEWTEDYDESIHRIEATGASTSIMPDLWLSADPNTNLSGQTNLFRTQFQETGDLMVAFPIVYYDEETNIEMDAYSTDVNAFVKEKIAAYITGTTDIEADWDAFQSTLRSMQSDRMIEIMQAAVDVRNANE